MSAPERKEMRMKKWIRDIREKTSGMGRRDTVSYVLTYYWYHILLLCAALAVLILFVVHYSVGNKKPEFTCVIVNQGINTEQDNLMTEAFSEVSGIAADRIEIDSNYNFSYGDVTLSGVNESSYEKFFLQWRNEELDAVILPESFYEFCVEMGGTFRDLAEMDTGSLSLYTDDGTAVGIILGEAVDYEENEENGESLLLVFPESGNHEEACQKFIDYIGQGTGSEG